MKQLFIALLTLINLASFAQVDSTQYAVDSAAYKQNYIDTAILELDLPIKQHGLIWWFSEDKGEVPSMNYTMQLVSKKTKGDTTQVIRVRIPATFTIKKYKEMGGPPNRLVKDYNAAIKDVLVPQLYTKYPIVLQRFKELDDADKAETEAFIKQSLDILDSMKIQTQ